MSEIRKAIEDLGNQFSRVPPAPRLPARSGRRMGRLLWAPLLAAVMLLAGTTFGLTLAAGRGDKVLHIQIVRAAHAPVARDVAADCPTEPGVATPSTTSAPAGSTISVTGAVYYRDEGGNLVDYSNEDFEVWWNLPQDDWTSVSNQSDTIAQGRIPPDQTTTDPIMVGDYRPNGACSLQAQFVVPDVSPGVYPVGVMRANGLGSTTLYGEFEFTVTPGNAGSTTTP